MRGATVCSGIGAPEQAMPHVEWVFGSEIDPAPSAVHAHRFPGVPNWGDMTKFQDWPDADIDLLVGGTPCQSFSIAGLRRGLADPRGNLALTFLAIAAKYNPRWILWENVPGVLSSDGGRDFGSFLGGLGQCGYGWAYRVLDAQHFGVPQRRRRVFVVGYLGDWRRAAAVLFERHSLQGHPAPRREKGKAVAALTADGVGTCGADDNQGQVGHLIPDVFPTLDCHIDRKWGSNQWVDREQFVIAASDGQPNATIEENLAPTLNCQHEQPYIAHSLRADGFDASEDGTGRATPLVPVAIQERAVSENADAGPDGAGYRTDGQAYTLEARGVPQAVCFDTTQIIHAANRSNPRPGDPCHPLASGAHAPAVAFQSSQSGFREVDAHATLDANNGSRRHNGVAIGSAVRRLIPRECERLQGFPDDFTLVPYRGGMMKDGPRYKMLGNSMAVPVVRWIGERIQQVDALSTESLAA